VGRGWWKNSPGGGGGLKHYLTFDLLRRSDFNSHVLTVACTNQDMSCFLLAAADPPVENNEDSTNLPTEYQISSTENQITQQLTQLRGLSVDLQNALLRSTVTAAHNLEQLEELRKNSLKNSIKGIAVLSVALIFLLIMLVDLIAHPSSFKEVFSLVVITLCLMMQWLHDRDLHSRRKKLQVRVEKAEEEETEVQGKIQNLVNLTFLLAGFLKPLHADQLLLRLLEGSDFEFLRGRIIVEGGVRFFRGTKSAATVSALDENIRQNIERILKNPKYPNVEEIKGLVESFIDFTFTVAYSKMDCDKQTKNQVGDADDADDDYVQYVDETSRATAERQKLLPKGS